MNNKDLLKEALRKSIQDELADDFDENSDIPEWSEEYEDRLAEMLRAPQKIRKTYVMKRTLQSGFVIAAAAAIFIMIFARFRIQHDYSGKQVRTSYSAVVTSEDHSMLAKIEIKGDENVDSFEELRVEKDGMVYYSYSVNKHK